MSENIAIIGSGFLGLTLALRLAEQGNRITVYESAPEIGGLASAWHIGDVVWDRHYHVTLLSDFYTRKIVEEIGLADEFEWVETKTGFYTDGELVSMSNTLEFLRFPPLDLIGKFRLGATIFYASRVNDWKALEKISVEDWLTKLSGKRTFEKMWKPLLKAKLGEAYKETSAAFIWATIQRMYAARNSGLKKEMFGYVRGGYAKVLEKFGEHLEEKGVAIRLNSRVERIENIDERVRVFAAENTGNNEKKQAVNNVSAANLKHPFQISARSVSSAAENSFDEFDRIILTCPANVAAKICLKLKSKNSKISNIRASSARRSF